MKVRRDGTPEVTAAGTLHLWNTVVVYNNCGARGPWYPRLAYGYPVECILPRSSYDSRPEPVYARLGKELPAGFTGSTISTRNLECISASVGEPLDAELVTAVV